MLPNASLAIVDPRKVRDYLLNRTHPENGGKCQWFESLGFSRRSQWTLARALRQAAAEGMVVSRAATRHGVKYVVDGALQVQSGGESPKVVRSVWIVEPGKPGWSPPTRAESETR